MTAPALTQIDLATGADAVRLRELHVLTWADTYASLLEPAFYRERLHHHHHRDWKALIRGQRAGGGGVLVARAADGVRGLCQYGPVGARRRPSGAGVLRAPRVAAGPRQAL
ncbi:MAG TPA: hypothetical protein VG321_07510 [Solirubrobacteraceae bacterium]|nr:hypothetical protein [Solirubrobacteraceae bacterium]